MRIAVFVFVLVVQLYAAAQTPQNLKADAAAEHTPRVLTGLSKVSLGISGRFVYTGNALCGRLAIFTST
jgi:hypothetical protein